LRIMTCQLQNLTIEIVSLLLDGLTCIEQRPDHGNQLGAILDQFLGPHRKDIELGTADHETDVLEQATDLAWPWVSSSLGSNRRRGPYQRRVGTFGGSLCTSSGHSSSTSCRISSETSERPSVSSRNLCSRSKSSFTMMWSETSRGAKMRFSFEASGRAFSGVCATVRALW